MENEFDGTLFFKGEGKKRKLYLNFTTRNDKSWENPIGENLLSDSLKQFAREEKGDGKKSVKLQEQSGRPVAVYLEGETEINKKEETQADYSKKDSAPSSDKSKNSHQKEFKSDKSKGESVNMNHEFHNPYNFVPAVPRENLTGELADREPSGHDCYAGDKFSGKLTVKMTVKTPLVVIDTARIEQGANDHKKFPVRVDADGKPYIAPTAVKGMLRSAYEAVTNSRMSVFTKHEDRLAFRGEVNDGLFVIPARIEGAKGNEKIVFYTGKSQIEEDGGPKITKYGDRKRGIPEIREPQYAAWIRMYETDDFVIVNNENVFKPCNLSPIDDVNNYPKHPEKAYAWVEEFKHNRRPFKYWKVMEMAYDVANLSTSFTKTPESTSSSSPQKVEGYICNTGKTMKSKHDERFFFGRNSTYVINLEKHHRDFWNSLIKNYRKQHESDFDSPPKEKINHGRNRGVEYSLEWSRQIQRTTKEETADNASLLKEELKDGTLCYAKVKWNGKSFEVLELYPVMISRRLHELPPEKLLDEGIKPTKEINRLSPADRVFGCVLHNPKNKQKANAYRGQVRIGSVICETEIEKAIHNFNNWLPMNILGQPKPQQGRFYVAKDKQGNAQSPQQNNENAGYKTGRGLRGRKVYPHHANLPQNDYWFDRKYINFADDNLTQKEVDAVNKPRFFREYLRPSGAKQQYDSQNRSIEGWVKPETEFEFEIHFINLSEVELGALIWLLDMDKYANKQGENNKYFHRFGGGKPLGFGSVSLSLENSEISNGGDLKDFYDSLDNSRQSSITPEECKSAFEKAVEDAKYQNILKSFKAACKGFDDGLPVHYPRTSKAPNSEGKSFEWFVDNSSKFGFKLPLPDLSDEIGLPLKPKS